MILLLYIIKKTAMVERFAYPNGNADLLSQIFLGTIDPSIYIYSALAS